MREKEESIFICGNCGYESRKWMGQCPSCKSWGTFSDEPLIRANKDAGRKGSQKETARLPDPKPVKDIDSSDEERIPTGFVEFSRVLGGGIVPGSLVLIGGDPGVGKSTLLLQTANMVAASGLSVIYISGEESLRQIRLRAVRIGSSPDSLGFVSATDIDRIIDLISEKKPALCVIDSIQTMFTENAASVPGSVTQVRECAQRLMRCAKTENIAIFLVGHVTKEGTVAGPRVLEHIVDTVVYFESGGQFGYRILRCSKNRFGSVNEIGVFEMSEEGLREVRNPSKYLLEGRPVHATGAAVTCVVEGSRPMLLEVQGLVAETQYGMARRQATGIDYNRFTMLLAVLSKRAGFNLNAMDAYVNIAGGMKINQPSADLAVAAAIISAYKNVVISGDTVIFGEIGLSGEVRSVPYAEERIREAVRSGFKRIIMPEINLRRLEGLKTSAEGGKETAAVSGRAGQSGYADAVPELIGLKYVSELFAVAAGS